MDPTQFFSRSRVTIVAGKGGVGKTTVSAAFGLAASRLGLRTQIIEIDGKSGLPGFFGLDELGFDELELAPNLSARTLAPDDALVEYLVDHGLKRISNRLAGSGALDMVATATPGIKDVLILGKVKQIERGGAYDVIVVDAPAAGHAISFLRSARGLLDAVKVGPIETQAREVMELLGDASRCQVMLVTLAEETPVNELVDTAFALEDHVGVALGPVVVNSLLSDIFGDLGAPKVADLRREAREAGLPVSAEDLTALADGSAFWGTRRSLQVDQVERLAAALPLDQIHLEDLLEQSVAGDGIGRLADQMIEGITALADLGDQP